MRNQHSIIAFQCFRQPQNVIEYFIDGRQYDNTPVVSATSFGFYQGFFQSQQIMDQIICMLFVYRLLYWELQLCIERYIMYLNDGIT